MSAKYFIWAEGAWREVDASSGRVVGWRQRARFVFARRGKLRVARSRAVLRALTAHAAGLPSAVRDGPRLSQHKHTNADKKQVVAAITDHVCCQAVCRTNTTRLEVQQQGTNTSAVSTRDVSNQCMQPAFTLHISNTKKRKLSVSSDENFEAKPGTVVSPRSQSARRARPVEQTHALVTKIRSHSCSTDDNLAKAASPKKTLHSPSKAKRKRVENWKRKRVEEATERDNIKTRSSLAKATPLKMGKVINISSDESTPDDRERSRTAKLDAVKKTRRKVSTEDSEDNKKVSIRLRSTRSQANVAKKSTREDSTEDSYNDTNVKMVSGTDKSKPSVTTKTRKENTSSDSDDGSNKPILLTSTKLRSNLAKKPRRKESTEDAHANLLFKSRTQQLHKRELIKNVNSKPNVAKRTRAKDSTEESEDNRIIAKFLGIDKSYMRKARKPVEEAEDNKNRLILLRSQTLKEHSAKKTRREESTEGSDDKLNRSKLLRSAKLNAAKKKKRTESTEESENHSNTLIKTKTKSPSKPSPKKRTIQDEIQIKRNSKLKSPVKRTKIDSTSENESSETESETNKTKSSKRPTTATSDSDQMVSQSILPRVNRTAETACRSKTASSDEVLLKDLMSSDGSPKRQKRSAYLELVISDEVVSLLRIYIERTEAADLYQFDTNEAYKRAIFYSINPVVDVERCPRIDAQLQRQRLQRFAAGLGLRSVSEPSTRSSYKFRPRNTKKDSVDSDSEENFRINNQNAKSNERKSKRVSDDRSKLANRSDKINEIVHRSMNIKDTLTVNRNNQFIKEKARSEDTRESTEGSSEEFEISTSKSKNKYTENKSRTTKRTDTRAEYKENVPVRSSNHASGANAAVGRRVHSSTHTISKRPSAAGAKEYSSLEDHAIVAWLSEGARATRVKGNQLWRELQIQYRAITDVDRSWQSLRNRYLRYILPSLGALHLPPAHASRLRAAAATGGIKRKRLEARRHSIFSKEPVVVGAATRRPRPPPSPPSSPHDEKPAPHDGNPPPTVAAPRLELRYSSDNEPSISRRSLRSSIAPTQTRKVASPRYSDITRQFAARHRARDLPSPQQHDSPPTTRTRKLFNIC